MKTHTIKHSDSAVCPCGGMVAYDASYSRSLPLGFGFAPGSARFQVDAIREKGWKGECMTCNATIFAFTSRRHSTRFPKSINDKLTVYHPGSLSWTTLPAS